MARHLRRSRRALGLLLVVLVALSGCDLSRPPGDGPLRFRDEVFADVTRTNGITYGQNVNYVGQTQSLALDLYEPAGDMWEERPLIIWVHGGSFKSGTRTSAEIVDEASVFARKGYVNASITYRLTPNGCTIIAAECITAMNHAAEDAKAAVRFFRANAATYRIDPDRIAIAGTSAGAITALNVGHRNGGEGSSGSPGFSSEVDAAVSLSGAMINMAAIGPGDAPALLFHGTADPLVPYANAKTTSDTAWNQGIRTTYLITWEGEGHVPYVAHRTEIHDLTTNFLYRRLEVATM